MAKFYSFLFFNILLSSFLPGQSSTSVNQLLEHSESMLNENPKESLADAIRARSLAEKDKDQKNVAAAIALIGMADYKMDQYDTAGIYINEAAKMSRKLKDTSTLVYCIHRLAYLELNKEHYVNALDSFESGLALAKRADDKKNVARCLDGEASIYESLDEDDIALELYQKSLDVAHEVNFEEWYPGVIYSIGDLLSKKDKVDEAVAKYNESIALSQKTHNLNNIGDCYHELADIFFYKKKDSQTAMEYVKKAMDIFQQTGSESSASRSRLLMSAILLRDKEYDLAITLADTSLFVGKKKNETSLQKDAAEILYLAYLGKGDKATALECHILFHRLSENDKGRELVKELTRNELTTKFEQDRAILRAEEEKREARQKLFQKIYFIIIILVSIIAALAIYAFLEKRKDNRVIAAEKEKSDQLLLNILPAQIAAELKENGHAKARNYDVATVLFADIKNFTKAAEMMTPEKLVNEIDYYFGTFDKITAKYNIEKIKTIGDAYLCVGGLPVADENNASYVVNAAVELQKFVAAEKDKRTKSNEIYFEVRVGIHTGPLVAGIVGLKKFAYDIWGDTVNVAARMEQYGEEGKINISGATYELIKTQFSCIYRGKIEAKNKGHIDMYFLENRL